MGNYRLKWFTVNETKHENNNQNGIKMEIYTFPVGKFLLDSKTASSILSPELNSHHKYASVLPTWTSQMRA